MSSITENKVLGDVLKYEAPLGYARAEFEVVRNLTATAGYEIGTPMGVCAAAVAAVQTVTYAALTADGGTLRLGFRGIWSAPIAWNANAAACKVAFELISGGVLVTFSAAAGATATTITFANTVGNIPDVTIDDRLLTDGGVVMTGDGSIATTTAGELVTMYEDLTTASCIAVLLDTVSLNELQDDSGEALRRAFVVRGPSVVDIDQVFAQASAGTEAALIAALLAVGIQSRTEPDETETGTPRI